MELIEGVRCVLLPALVRQSLEAGKVERSPGRTLRCIICRAARAHLPPPPSANRGLRAPLGLVGTGKEGKVIRGPWTVVRLA